MNIEIVEPQSRPICTACGRTLPSWGTSHLCVPQDLQDEADAIAGRAYSADYDSGPAIVLLLERAMKRVRDSYPRLKAVGTENGQPYVDMHIPAAPPEPPRRVIPFRGITRMDLEPDVVLENLKGKLDGFVISGYDVDGALVNASTYADGGTALWLLENCKNALLNGGS